MSTKNTEQSSKSNAEDLLPKFVTHVNHPSRLFSQHDDSSIPNSMCFYSPDNSVFVGLLIEETVDSFLVGAAAKLRMTKDRVVTAEEISVQPMIRVMKSSISYLVVPTDLTIYHYFAFLEEYGYNKLPDYFTKERKAFIESVRSDTNYKSPMDLSPHETAPEPPGESIHSFVPHKQSESIH